MRACAKMVVMVVVLMMMGEGEAVCKLGANAPGAPAVAWLHDHACGILACMFELLNTHGDVLKHQACALACISVHEWPRPHHHPAALND